MIRTRKWRNLMGAALALTMAGVGLLSSERGLADGVSGTGLMGYITQWRSLVINGVHYDTTNAIVRINGELDELENLRLGQQIAAQVEPETLSVLEIDQYDAVSGKIEAITMHDPTLPTMQIKVAGQTVIAGIDTVYHIDDPQDLKKGDKITVGGLRDPEDRIVATAMEKGGGDGLVTGFIGEIGQYHFMIGDLRVISDYHAELVAEPWFFVGAGVLVEGKVHEGELEAERVIQVPADQLVLQELIEFGEMRIDGEITAYDTASNELTVIDFRVALDEHTTMQDYRDEMRPFGLVDVYPGDHVSLAVEQHGGRLYARKLVRVKKTDPLLRGEIEALDSQSDTLVLFGKTFSGMSEVKEKRFAREKVDDDEFADVFEVADQIAVKLHPKTGEVKKLEAWSNCREVIATALSGVDLDDFDKDDAKALEKAARDDDYRLYLCMKRERFKHWFD